MAQKVATVGKIKLRQETTSLGQITTVTAKPTISNKAFINTDTRHFKIQTGDMGPPLAWPQIWLTASTACHYVISICSQ